MNPSELLGELARRGVQVRAEGGRLQISAPKGALSAELKERLAQDKAAVLALLQEQEAARARPGGLVPDAARRHEPFPLTDIQQAYWVGRKGLFGAGAVSPHVYFEFEGRGLDVERLGRAWRRLVARHDMLRAIVTEEGTQRVLEQVPDYVIAVEELGGEAPEVVRSRLEATRERMSHQVVAADRWPLFELRASRLDAERVRLHVSLDLLVVDGWSLFLLFEEWRALYEAPERELPALEVTFRDYVLALERTRSSPLYAASEAYWAGRTPSLPPAPVLPLAPEAGAGAPRFTRRTVHLEASRWAQLKARAQEADVTPSGLLCAAFAQVLARWSRAPHFTLNLTFNSRRPLHPQVDRLVGDFTSTLLLEVDFREGGFAERARRLQHQLTRDLDHHQVSGIQLLRELNRARGGSGSVLMPIVFTSHLSQWYARDAEPSRMQWLGETLHSVSQTPQVWLDVIVLEEGGELLVHWDAVEERFPPGLVADMFESYEDLLRGLVETPVGQWSAQAPLPRHQQALWERYNATSAPVPGGLLHQGFLEQAARHPERPAVVTPERTVSYGELLASSSRLARWLREEGATPNTLVAVVMEKGWEQVAAVLGILQAGAAYLPVDPAQPALRLATLLEDGRVRLAITQRALAGRVAWPAGVRPVCVDDEPLARLEPTPLAPVQRPEDLAYVIYTSGSTGRPKGVVIDHRGALNTIVDINQRFGVGAEDRVLGLSALSFDLSVYDVFGTLAAGATLVLPRAEGVRDPAHWAELVRGERVTVWNSVPALLDLMVEHAAGRPEALGGSLRLALLSGDWIPVHLPERVRALAPGLRLISLGGATEASIWSILYPIEQVEPGWRSIPYGRPMLSQRIHVLGPSLEPCPTWVPGELYIGGVGLAQGYWADPEKTAARFPTHPRTGERLYCTGDLGRMLPDGNVEFLGREDFQVKVQGHRIELGEIEAALEQHEAVRSAVVTAVGERGGPRRLVGYVVPEAAASVTAEALREHVRQRVPEHMVPSAFLVLESFPLTANGKVDRAALPVPEPLSGAEGEEPAEAVSGAWLSRVSQVATALLNRADLKPSANLVAQGATSVDLIRLAVGLERQMGHRPEMNELFRMGSLARIAAWYEQRERQRTPEEGGAPGAQGSTTTWEEGAL